jgi:hypothetical protein
MQATGLLGGHRRRGALLGAPVPGDLLPNYWNAQRADPEVILPSSGLEAQATAGLGAWGAWTTIQAATPRDLVLLAAHVSKMTTASGSLWGQIGVDPTGGTSFTVRAEFAFHAYVFGSGASPIHSSTFRFEPYLIPGGSRVAMRGWVTAGDFSFQGYLAFISPTATWVDPWPNTYIQGARATNLLRYPSVPSWVTLPALKQWVQVIASAATDLLLNAAEMDPSAAAGTRGEVLELGIGAPGAEVVYSRIGFPSMRVFGWAFGHQQSARKALVLAGERVSVRKVAAAPGPYRVALYAESLLP